MLRFVLLPTHWLVFIMTTFALAWSQVVAGSVQIEEMELSGTRILFALDIISLLIVAFQAIMAGLKTVANGNGRNESSKNTRLVNTANMKTDIAP
jgi:hypothetical protein